MSVDGEPPDEGEKFKRIPVPENPTVKDVIDAVDTLANENQYEAFYAELHDNLGEEVAEQLWDIRDDTVAATTRLLGNILIEDMVGDLPITIIPRQDFEQLLALERAKVAAPPQPVKPIEEVDHDRAAERLAQIFADVGGGDLPPNAEWTQALQEAKSAVPLIVAARRLGAPDEYIRRCAYTHAKTFLSGKISRSGQVQNFGVIARFLKNMKFGSDEDVAFFEKLASGD